MPRQTPAQPAVASSAISAARLGHVRLELLELLIGAIAHELGNLASPIGLIADSLGAATTAERRESLAGTLRLVASGMRALTTTARHLRGGSVEEQLAPAAPRALTEWWGHTAGMINDVVPDAVTITGAGVSGAVPPHVFAPLTIALPALCRAATLRCPAARTVHVRLAAAADAGTLTGDVWTETRRGHAATRDVATPWIQLAGAEVRAAGGAVRSIRDQQVTGWHLVLPFRDASPDAACPPGRS